MQILEENNEVVCLLCAIHVLVIMQPIESQGFAPYSTLTLFTGINP